MKKLIKFFLFLSMATSVLADEVINQGLTLTIPSQGQKNWSTSFKNNFAIPISVHDHTGGGDGVNIGTSALSSNAVTDTKIRLSNDAYLRARNAANSADLNICKIDSANALRFDSGNITANTRADLGLGTASTPTFTSLNLSGANILQTTSDGSDNGFMQIGHGSNARGAFSLLYGNEHANTGQHTIASGNVSGGNINLAPGGTTTFQLLQSGGHLVPATDNTYDVGSTSRQVRNIYLPVTSHSPTVTGNGSMTVTATVRQGQYQKIGKVVYFEYVLTFTIGGTPNTYVQIPGVAAGVADSIYKLMPTGFCTDGDGTTKTCFWQFDGTNIRVLKSGAFNWTAGSSGTVSLQGWYVLF